MRVTRALMAEGHHGVRIPGFRPEYKAYRSPYGPKYKIQPNFHGINAGTLYRFGYGAALFGGVAGVAAIFFATWVPRVRVDIMEKVPFFGSWFHKEVAPEDNPF